MVVDAKTVGSVVMDVGVVTSGVLAVHGSGKWSVEEVVTLL